MKIKTKPFDFEKLVRSHGWVFLSPFEWCENTKTLSRPLRLSKNKKIKVHIKSRNTTNYAQVDVSWGSNHSLSDIHKREIKKKVIRMLRLEEDFSDFHKLCKRDPILSFVFKTKCGGMLRGETAFEDLIKTVCTTNCDWRNTKKMCISLCQLHGGRFPYPEDILKYSPKKLSKIVPLGYRAETVWNVAYLTAKGKLPLDEWVRDGNYGMVRNRLKEIRGVGNYCINHMLVLLGDYSNIPVDSEVRTYLRNVHFDGKDVSAREAVKPYEQYGEFRFLAYKFSRMARKLNYIDK